MKVRFGHFTTLCRSMLLLGLLALGAGSAEAATFTVTNVSESSGSCTAAAIGDGCSLREAIGAANGNADTDTITFAPGVTGIIQLTGRLPNIATNMSITGPGANLVSVRRNGVAPYGLLKVNSGKIATISGLTFTNGLGVPSDGFTASENGGAIENSGTLTLDGCTISNSTAFYGGGIYSGNGSVLTIRNSTISGNTANYIGGGIYGATLTIENSTISGNRALDNDGFGAIGGHGGGIDVNGTTTLNSVTISNNSVTTSGGGILRSSGGLTLTNCIVAGNYVIASGAPSEISGTHSGGSNLVGGDPKLAPLQDNGGTTFTQRPMRGSPAIDTGDTVFTTDQIGSARPYASADDKGSVEVKPVESLIVTTLADENDGTSDPIYGAGTSLREALIYANTRTGQSSAITFETGLTGVFQLASALPSLKTTISITGNGSPLTVRRDAGGNYRLLFMEQGSTVSLSGLTFTNGNASNDDGGAIKNEGALTITACTLSGNSAAFGGGAIYTRFGTLNITNSTVSGNTAATYGGGICNVNGAVDIESCTITNNTAAAGQGSGVCSFRTDRPTRTESRNSIIAGNVNSDVDYVNTNNFQSNGYNVVGTGNATGSFNASGDRVSILAATLKLDPLQVNSPGITATHKPQSGSLVINTGATPIATDQRGVTRPQGTLDDVGAYEYDSFLPSLVVTTLDDENNGTSDPAYGAGTSLREAINFANSNADASTITFSSALFPGNAPATILLSSALPAVATPLSLTGPGALASPGPNSLTIRRASGTFGLLSITSNVTVGITGLNLTNGDAGGGNGGAISNVGVLTLTSCSLSDNKANRGGAIFNTGTLTLVRCTLSANTGVNSGGAIRSEGSVLIQNSTISGNEGNTAGGGVWIGGSALIQSVTFSLNKAASGGAIYSESDLTIVNTILKAGATGANYAQGGSGTLNSQGFNLSSDATGPNGADDRRSVDPKIGGLADNGGPTQTHLPQVGSPVLNAGSPGVPFATDQRGVERPQNGRIDIGAVEFFFTTNESLLVTTLLDEDNGTSDPTVGGGAGTSLREAIGYANSNIDLSAITFDPALFPANTPGTIQLTGSLPFVITPVTIAGPGAKILTLRLQTGVNGSILTINRDSINPTAAAALSGLTITNATDTAIRNYGLLTLENCAITGNSGGNGGALLNNGTATVTGCTFSGNSAQFGGAIYNGNFSPQLELTMRNSTLSGNTASSYGGAMVDLATQSLLQNCTIASNTAPSGQGGGLARAFSGPARPDFALSNTILAGNTGDDVVLLDGATIQSLGYNLIGTGSVSSFNATGDQAGVANPLLAPLAYIDTGQTQTHAPLIASLAVNGGNTDLAVDQNGRTRPQNGVDDIGAVEIVATEIVVTTNVDENNGSTDVGLGTGTSLREAIIAANGSNYALITFSPTVFNTRKTIALAGSGLPDITSSMSITGPAAGVLIHSPNLVTGDPALNINTGSVVLSALSFQGASRGATLSVNGGTTRIQNCTFTGGGNRALNNNGGTTNVQNSTFSGLSTPIFNQGGNLNIEGCTIADNTGTGVMHPTATVGTTTVSNCIVAGNTTNLSANISASTNVVGTLAEAGLATLSGKADLKDNGGPTYTIATLPGSPAINTGNSGLSIDQRGVARPQGAGKDIGAYEFQLLPSLVVTTTSSENNGTSDPNFGTGTSLQEAIDYANTRPGADTITFSPSIFNTRKTITTNTSINSDVTIVGPQAGLTLHGGGGRILTVDSGTVVLTRLTFQNPGGNNSGVNAVVKAAGTLTLRNCTVTGQNEGISSENGDLILENSTFTGNSHAIYKFGTGALTMRNCTVVGNGRGVLTFGGAAFIYNSIVAGNTTVNLGSTPTVSSNNLIGTLADAEVETASGAPVLKDNGGPTYTVALLPSSPAVNGGNDANAPQDSTDDDGDSNTTETTPFDQRGTGFARIRSTSVDIGAYEVPNAGPVITGLSDQVMPANSSRAVNFGIVDAENEAMTVTVSSNNATLLPTGSLVLTGTGANRTLTITPAANLGGTATVSVNVGDGTSTTARSFALRVTEPPSLVVTTLGDTEDNADNLTSLREAIIYANTKAGDDTITFQVGPGTIELLKALPALSSNIVIQATGSTVMRVQPVFAATTNFRIIDVASGATVCLKYLSMGFGVGTADPNGFSSGEEANGACVRNAGTLTIQYCTINNSESAYHGGGIANSGTLTLLNTTVENNQNFTFGGGIYNTGTLTLRNSTVSTNRNFSNTNGYGYGGGIYNTGALTVDRSTIAGNIGPVNGSGIHHAGTAIQITNSIVAANLGNGSNLSGYTPTGGNNILTGTATEVGLDTASGNIAAKNNGGPTRTIALLAGSPAINAGDPAYAAGQPNDYDQRGPGFRRVSGGRLDIGAFESQPTNTQPTATGPGSFTAVAGVGQTLTLTGSDPESDPLIFKITSLPAQGTLYDGPTTGGTAITTVPYTVTDASRRVTYLAPVAYRGSDSFVFVVNDGAIDSSARTVSGTVVAPVGTTGAIISEFRLRGTAGASDEYVEIANTTTAALNVGGWNLRYPGASGMVTVPIPANTFLPKGGHLLFAGSGYSLAGTAAGDVALAVDIPDTAGVALHNAAGTRVDAAGFASSNSGYKEGAGIAANITASGEFAFLRKQAAGPLVDTNNNASDFEFVSLLGASVNGTLPKVGTPGPEGLTSPQLKNDTIAGSAIDNALTAALPAARNNTPVVNGEDLGTLSLRYKIKNNTGQLLTRLRFRAVNITAGPPPNATTADTRIMSSGDITVTVNGTPVTVKGSTLEAPSPANLGGLNGTLTADVSSLPGGGIAAGSVVNVQLMLRVVVKGTYKVTFNLEGLN